jgi:chromosome segregation protein
MVFDLFRPTRPDVLGGQRGGFVMRGGSSLDTPATLGVGSRREQPFFDREGPLRAAAAGFRLVVSAPWLALSGDADTSDASNKVLLDGLEKARARLLKPPAADELAGASKAADDIGQIRAEYAEEIKRLEAERAADQTRLAALEQEVAQAREAGARRPELDQILARSQAELNRAAATSREGDEQVARLNRELAGLQTQLEKSAAQLAEYDREVRREQFASALFVANGIYNVSRRMAVLGSSVKAMETDLRGPATAAQRQKVQRLIGEARLGIAKQRELRAAQFRHYVTLVTTLAEADTAAIEAADRSLAARLSGPLGADLAGLRQKLMAHVTAMAAAHGAMAAPTLDRWLEELAEAKQR